MKNTHKEQAPSIETPAHTKSINPFSTNVPLLYPLKKKENLRFHWNIGWKWINMDIWAVGTSNKLFIRGS